MISFSFCFSRWNVFFFTLANLVVLLYFVTQTRRIESGFKMHIDRRCEQCHRVSRFLQNMTSTRGSDVAALPKWISSEPSEPIIYVITPTYQRGTQQPDLTRLAQTLMLVRGLHWIVIEDAAGKSPFVIDLLVRTGVNYTHLHVETPQVERKSKVFVFFTSNNLQTLCTAFMLARNKVL